MIKKLFILFPIPFFVASCANIDNSKLISSVNFEIHNQLSSQAIKSNQIIDSLLRRIYKNEIELNSYKKQQESSKLKDDFLNEIAILKEEYLTKSTTDNLQKIQNLINKNWYFVLKNINLFYGHFTSWFAFPDSNSGKHSSEFRSLINNTNPSEDFNFTNNYWENIREGDESQELANTTVIYLQKQKVIFRFLITDVLSERPKMHFSGIGWNFPFSKSTKISAGILSDVVHSALIHKYQEGYDLFENSVVKEFRYGLMEEFILLPKENHE